LREQFFYFPEHIYTAVDAGIHIAAVTMRRVLDHFNVIHTFVDYTEGNVEFFGDFTRLKLATRLLGCTVTKDAGKVDGRYVDSLIYHELDSEGAVQASG
jgi:hypothetical protein